MLLKLLPIERIPRILPPLIILTFALGLADLSFAQRNSPFPVKVAPAVEIEMAPVSWLLGTVIGHNDSKLAAEVEGRLESVLDVGDRIEGGEVVAHIESTTYSLRLAEAEAQIIPIKVKLNFYNRESKRLQELAKQNNAAKNRLDEIASSYDEYAGLLKAAQLRVEQAKVQLDRTTIKAPFDGIVSERYHSRGERVSSGDEIIRLVDTSNLEIQVRIPQSYIQFLDIGMELDATEGDERQVATIVTLVPVGDVVSRLYELRLSLEGGNWPVGHAVRVAIPRSKRRSVTAVPRDALVIRKDDIKVVKVNLDNVVELISIKTGIAVDSLIEVIGDIEPNDNVVIRGNERVRQGQKVTIQ